MISTVTQSINMIDKSFIVRSFSRFKARYGNLWTSRVKEDREWEFVIDDWFNELSAFSVNIVGNAIDDFMGQYQEFPPDVGKIAKLCLKYLGVPDIDDTMRKMVKKEFDHPVIKIIYNKIGSWKLSNATEKEIRERTQEYYQSAIVDFKQNQQTHWAALQNFNEEQKVLPPPPKNPTKPESEAFKKFLDDAYASLDHKKSYIAHDTYTVFDENKIKKTNKAFDPVVFEEYKKYLLSIPETETLKLPPIYVYDRSLFLAAKEQPNFLREKGYNPNGNAHKEGQNCEPPRRSNGPQKVYKNWASD